MHVSDAYAKISRRKPNQIRSARAKLFDFLRKQNPALVYFANEGYLNRIRTQYELAFTRTAIKTDRPRGASKLIQLPTAGWPPSGRIDPAYSNIILQSQTFDNASWSKTRMNATTPVVADDTTAPDGTVTADRLVEDNTAASNHSILQSPAVSNGINYTASLFIKYSGTRGWCRFGFTNAAFGAVAIYVNIQTGAIGTVVGSPVAYRVEEWPNGWFRIIITAASTGTVGGYQIFTATADNTISYNGDNASGFYVWGAMMETGSIAHPYYPTTTVAAGPDADVLTANVDVTAGPSGERTYAIMYEQDYPMASLAANTTLLLHVLKSTNPDSIEILRDATGTAWQMVVRDENVAQVNLRNNTNINAGRHVMIATLRQSDSHFYFDGYPETTTTTNSTFTHTSSSPIMYIGQSSVANRQFGGGCIRFVAVLDRAVPATNIGRLTSLVLAANP